MSDNPQPAAYSVPEAANYTGLSRSSLYRMMAAGELAFLKIGARRLIRVPSWTLCLIRRA